MPAYKAPLRDMQFVLHELLQTEQLYQQMPKYQENVSLELINQYLEVAADFCENELAPLNYIGDQQGCHLDKGKVKLDVETEDGKCRIVSRPGQSGTVSGILIK